MSASSKEPENGATPTSMRLPQSQELPRDVDQKIGQRRVSARRQPSSSLLTKGLSPTYETDETITETPTSYDSEGHIADVHRRLNNFLDSNGSHEITNSSTPFNAMAMAIAPVSAHSHSLGSSPTSSSRFDLSDISHVNSLFTNHRDFLRTSRARGISLERTPKEQMVQYLPETASGSNPGDTGMPHSPIPLTQDSLNTISDTPPTEGVRARYRMWRDTRADVAAEKTWSIGDKSSGQVSEGPVEKSITEALAGVEPNNRSRKASHSLRFFKEGLPDEKPKKRDTRDGSRAKDKSPRSNDSVSSDIGYFGTPNDALSKEKPPSSQFSDQKLENSKLFSAENRTERTKLNEKSETSTDSEWPTKSVNSDLSVHGDESNEPKSPLVGRPDTLPARLLDDLRKRHNLTPPPAKRSSFSTSIPVTDSEKTKLIREKQQTVATSRSTHALSQEQLQAATRSDEEDSSEEQISSALFVPHQSRESPDRKLKGQSGKDESVFAGRRASSSEVEQWLVEEVHAKDTDDKIPAKSTTSEVPPTALKSSDLVEADNHFDFVKTSELVHDQTSDGGYSTKEEDSNLTDDPETTPTARSNAREYMSKNQSETLHAHQQATKAPLEAIELIPYKHQVGGHTTMWRFSKRAVCKQLNNRENEFYETVEHYHPALLKFMPRYIGVLNVTFEKQLKRKATIPKDGNDANDGIVALEDPSTVPDTAAKSKLELPSDQNGQRQVPDMRIVSQSLQSARIPTPTVTFADNRHIIPTSLQPFHLTERRHRSLNDDTSLPPVVTRRSSQSQPPLPNSEFTFRPTLSDKHAASWGATTVNKKLRNEVFGEAFLQQPIPVHRHRKPGHQHRVLAHRTVNPGALRPSNSESNLRVGHDRQVQVSTSDDGDDGSMRKRAMKGAAERNGLTRLTPLSTASDTGGVLSELPGAGSSNDVSEVEFDDHTGSSAPEHESLPELLNSKRKRRYSSGGLRRKPDEVTTPRGDLKYFEEADDAGYKGDGEEEVFKMDPDPPVTESSDQTATNSHIPVLQPSAEFYPSTRIPSYIGDGGVGKMLPAARDESQGPAQSIVRPVNPKEAQTQADSRVEYFLLLEDLTAGMKRPCIMDLKMGTRQYGVEANEKKQKSQRRKCAETTSQQLGVRVCGLQVWDAASQSYIFQDKYFGRDLKVGIEFQSALMRFLYDGVDYSSVLHHIPTILHKISQLEILIKNLQGYRFYAASLLLFYDGEVEEDDTSTDTSTTGQELKITKRGSIDFKIADFANCVALENSSVAEKPCPPQHPNAPDQGFLRGLRSLRHYFLAIQRDIIAKEKNQMVDMNGVARTEMNGQNGHVDWEEDLGEVSY